MLATIAVIISAVGVCIGAISLLFNRRIVRNQIMNDLISAYQQPTMLAALNRLYEFSRYCEANSKDIQLEYQAQLDMEESNVSAMNYAERLAAIEGTLDNQRRQVSYFYARVHWLFANGALPPKTFFGFWNIGDIDKLFECILIPIKKDPESRLRHLIDIARNCETSKNNASKYWIIPVAIVVFVIILIDVLYGLGYFY